MATRPSLCHALSIIPATGILRKSGLIAFLPIGLAVVVDQYVRYVTRATGSAEGERALDGIASVWLYLFVAIHGSGIACSLDRNGYPFLALVPISAKWRVAIHLCEHFIAGLLLFAIPLALLFVLQGALEGLVTVGSILFAGVTIRSIICFLLEYKMAYEGMNTDSTMAVSQMMSLFVFVGLASYVYGDFGNSFVPSISWLLATVCLSPISLCLALQAPRVRAKQYGEGNSVDITGDLPGRNSVSGMAVQQMNRSSMPLFDESMFSHYDGVTWRIWASIIRYEIPLQMMVLGGAIVGFGLVSFGCGLTGMKDVDGIAWIIPMLFSLSWIDFTGYSPLRSEIRFLQSHPISPHQVLRGIGPYVYVVLVVVFELFYSKNPLYDGIWEMLGIVDITMFLMLLIITGCSPSDPEPNRKRANCTEGEVEVLKLLLFGLATAAVALACGWDSWALRLSVIPILYWAICWMWKRY